MRLETNEYEVSCDAANAALTISAARHLLCVCIHAIDGVQRLFEQAWFDLEKKCNLNSCNLKKVLYTYLFCLIQGRVIINIISAKEDEIMS